MSGKELAELKARVAKLEAKSERVTRIEKDLLDAARQWARCTALGYYVERRNGEKYRVSFNARDVDYHAAPHLSAMRAFAVELLKEETAGDL